MDLLSDTMGLSIYNAWQDQVAVPITDEVRNACPDQEQDIAGMLPQGVERSDTGERITITRVDLHDATRVNVRKIIDVPNGATIMLEQFSIDSEIVQQALDKYTSL